jgi:hypothetical protein
MGNRNEISGEDEDESRTKGGSCAGRILVQEIYADARDAICTIGAQESQNAEDGAIQDLSEAGDLLMCDDRQNKRLRPRQTGANRACNRQLQPEPLAMPVRTLLAAVRLRL